VSPTLNIIAPLLVIFCKKEEEGGLFTIIVAITVTYQVNFHPNFDHP
jgi:hypothetical protein